MLTDEQLAELNRPITQGPDALWTLAEHKRILFAEVQRLQGALEDAADQVAEADDTVAAETARAAAAEAEVKRLQAKVDATAAVADQLDQDATDNDATRDKHIIKRVEATGSWSDYDDPRIARLGALVESKRKIAATLRRALDGGEGQC